MTGPDETPDIAPTPQSQQPQGGAGRSGGELADPDAPIGYASKVGGESGAEDAPRRRAQTTFEASKHGPRTSSERLEAGESERNGVVGHDGNPHDLEQ